jgi:NTE family protein
MRTFVLSGGGNRGPLQVGALRALMQHGIAPKLIVGSSAGALNGAYLAVDPTSDQVERMADLWRDAGRRKLFTPSPAKSVAKLLRGRDHLVENTRIRDYIIASIPRDRRTFGSLRVPFYATICHLLTQTLYVYGDDPDSSVVDAVLTSSAVPAFFPPHYHQGQAFVDGGVVANLPLKLAVSRGATEIWAIDLAFDVDRSVKVKSALDIAGYAVRRPLYDNVLSELEWAVRQPGVTVNHIAISAFQNTPLGDFSKTEAMFTEGERAMQVYLSQPMPNRITYPHHYTAHTLPPGPPGSIPFVEQQRGVCMTSDGA